MNSHLQGKSYRRQSLANIARRQLENNLPGTYGWQYVDTYQEYKLPVYCKDDVFMMRHPAGDCWLIYWAGVWQPIDLHVSELSARLEDIKKVIFWDVILDQFEPAAMAA